MTHSRKLVAMLACCVAASAALVGNASAWQIFQERFHDEGNVVLEDYCGADGLTVRVDFVLDVKVSAVEHGSERLPSFLAVGTETAVLTNLANGTAITSLDRITEKDLKVTDNGDGTLTTLTLNTGNSTLWGPDGKAIARNPGQVRLKLLIDHGGTPSDPSDDELISAELIKESTGRNDDGCEAAVAALT
jgi:hypothetical protein